jgi:tetratricopeptide (TPR) repeat protein
MKLQYFLIIFLLISPTFTQANIDTLIAEGNKFLELNQHSQAISTFQNVLQINPTSVKANFYLAVAFFNLRDYTNTIKYSETAIKLDKKFNSDIYNLQAQALDSLGETKEAIKIYKKSQKIFKDDYQTFYNLGCLYFRIEKFQEAGDEFANAIKINPNFPNAHYMLGMAKSKQYKRVESIIALNYFLLLEPKSDRSEIAYNQLRKIFRSNSYREMNKGNVYISFTISELSSEFAPIYIYLNFLLNVERNMKTDAELFAYYTEQFFTKLNNINDRDDEESVWWSFYNPFFTSLVKAHQVETYCRYISQSVDLTSQKWLEENQEKLILFDEWLITR